MIPIPLRLFDLLFLSPNRIRCHEYHCVVPVWHLALYILCNIGHTMYPQLCLDCIYFVDLLIFFSVVFLLPNILLLHPWWRHQMETFSALLALCEENSPVTGEFPSQSPVTRSFDVFFELRLNRRSSKQSRRLWLETPSRSLWRHRNASGSSASGDSEMTPWDAVKIGSNHMTMKHIGSHKP